MPISAVNPATGETLATYKAATPKEVKRAVEAAQAGFLKRTSFADRAARMRTLAKLLRERATDYAELMAHEMGKPVKQGRAEIEKCAIACEFYAENAEAFLKREEIKTEAGRSFVTFEPLGVILAVMPWNFPFWQVFRFAAPSLMAGNAAVLKHASNVPGCALAVDDLFRRADLPLYNVLVGSDQVAALIEDPRIRAVTLTGSGPAGKAVAKKAGELLKKAVLELGGSDPYVVLEDADLDAAVATCAAGRLINSGQSCIAAKRFIVVEPIRKKFESLLVEHMRAKKVGDPMLEDTDVGPLARHDLRDDLHAQVQKSIKKGAACLLGGKIPRDKGAFYPPTVLANVKQGMPAYDEELFGPVAAVIGARDEADAIRIANDTPFGLGAAVFTRDLARGERIAATQLEAGSCFVNAFVKSDPRLPFGGIKESGFGRELSHYGIREFVNIKTVYVK